MTSQHESFRETCLSRYLLTSWMIKTRPKAKWQPSDKKMKNLQSELQEHWVEAVEGIPRTVDLNQKGRQKATRFCNYCRTNGHTPSWCRKKIRDEELKRIENERTAEEKVTFAQDYNRKPGPGHGSEQWARGQDSQRRNQDYTNDGPTRSSPTAYEGFSPRPNFAYGNHNPNNGRSYDQRPNPSFQISDGNWSRNGSFNNQNGNCWSNGVFFWFPINWKWGLPTEKLISPTNKWSTCFPLNWQSSYDWFCDFRTKVSTKNDVI